MKIEHEFTGKALAHLYERNIRTYSADLLPIQFYRGSVSLKFQGHTDIVLENVAVLDFLEMLLRFCLGAALFPYRFKYRDVDWGDRWISFERAGGEVVVQEYRGDKVVADFSDFCVSMGRFALEIVESVFKLTPELFENRQFLDYFGCFRYVSEMVLKRGGDQPES